MVCFIYLAYAAKHLVLLRACSAQPTTRGAAQKYFSTVGTISHGSTTTTRTGTTRPEETDPPRQLQNFSPAHVPAPPQQSSTFASCQPAQRQRRPDEANSPCSSFGASDSTDFTARQDATHMQYAAADRPLGRLYHFTAGTSDYHVLCICIPIWSLYAAGSGRCCDRCSLKKLCEKSCCQRRMLQQGCAAFFCLATQAQPLLILGVLYLPENLTTFEKKKAHAARYSQQYFGQKTVEYPYVYPVS